MSGFLILCYLELKTMESNSLQQMKPNYQPDFKSDERFEKDKKLNQKIDIRTNFHANEDHCKCYFSFLVLEDSVFENCKGFGSTFLTERGGCFCVIRCQLQLINSHLISNQATYGGSFYSNSSNLIIERSNFVRNIAIKLGGAIYAVDKNHFCLTHIYLSNFEKNTANCCGGAIFLEETTKVYIYDTKYLQNSAAMTGGGIHGLEITKILLSGCNFTENYLTDIYNSLFCNVEKILVNILAGIKQAGPSFSKEMIISQKQALMSLIVISIRITASMDQMLNHTR